MLAPMARAVTRCGWCGTDPLYVSYHDEEWGVPVHDDQRLFEFLILEGAQAGLSWITILRKREAYRRVFAGFDPERVARFVERDVKRLLEDAGIVRHRGKIEAAIANARATLALREAGTSLEELVWKHRPNPGKAVKSIYDLPSTTPESNALSKELKRAGFRFVGPTTVYASMQACGVVNDHIARCFVRADVQRDIDAAVRKLG
jgi:DNA-3-methyladenine glycosylase I